MRYGIDIIRDYNNSIKKEWLLTNGLGGFAASTVIGANTRRYHGLLVSSFEPPTQRMLILSKLNEVLEIDGEEYSLCTDVTGDYVSKGYRYQTAFINDILPTLIYRVKDVLVEKKIAMAFESNTVIVTYKINSLKSNVKLKIAPLINLRDYHHLSNKINYNFEKKIDNLSFEIKDIKTGLKLNIYSNIKSINKADCYFENMTYLIEKERGLDYTEDHYIPAIYEEPIEAGIAKELWFCVTTDNRVFNDGIAELKKEEERLKRLQKNCSLQDEFSKKLYMAAIGFITRRETTRAKTIIAGYPWFADWGRDTMIAFTGITLCTKRFEDAREILRTFAAYEKNGLIPNTFPDNGEEPAYNTVDASLWFFEACYKYLIYTKDIEFINKEMYPVLSNIISYYEKGTLFDIYMDEDYLISAGNESTQLTWMDAMVHGKPVTPRYGKCVEINALWYNALKIMSKLCKQGLRHKYENMAEKVRESFIKAFDNGENGLFDVVRDGYQDAFIRPNQIIASSLSFAVITGDIAKNVVDIVWDKLYTPFGLRTLDKSNINYRGSCQGSPAERDLAYHQGTVWTWLMGHFITSFVRAYGSSKSAIDTAKSLLKPIEEHLNEGCLFNISEIFDGDWPHNPRGCFAQAWSVGEILRCWHEDILL